MQDSGVPLYILDLHGETIEVGHGYWVTMRFSLVPVDEERRHGLCYAVTFHAPGGKRLIGYDNAHPPRIPASGPARKSKQVTTRDHVHKGDIVKPYEFKTPEILLEDFWRDVELLMKKKGLE